MSTTVDETPTTDLVRWAMQRYRSGEEPCLGTVRHLLVDHLANVFGGLNADSSRLIVDFVASRPGPFRTFGAIETSEEYAALVAGASAHALEYDDTHQPSSSHPGSAVFPAALVVGTSEGRSFGEVAAAVVAGYEVACRVGEAATPRGQYERGFHPTGTSGVFGAALAAGLLAGLSEDQLVSALGIGLAVSAGSMAFLADGSWTKRIHPGWAAHSGIIAARLAGRGFFGPQEPLTCHDGFLHSHSLSAEPALLTAGLDVEPLAITRTSVKAHACCRYMQAPIDGILELVAEHGIATPDVERVDIGILEAGWDIVVVPYEQKARPASIVDAQFSMPFGAAAALLHGRVGVRESDPAELRSGPLRELMTLVHCHRSPRLEELFPATWAADVAITCRDGRRVETFVSSPKGDPENPLTADEMAAKFHTLTHATLAADDQERIVGAVTDLAPSEPISSLQALVADARVDLGREHGVPDRPLSGLRIITVSQYGAGPFASLHFADLGADVIKVEDWATGGDMSRRVPPYAEGDDSLFFQSLNRSKRSIGLDLRHPEGRAVLRDLVAKSDAVFSNLRGDRPGRLGLTYDALKDVNPAIVCCSLSGYGTDGPRAGDPAFDYLIQSETGIVSMTGEPDSTGTRCGISIVDFSAGYAASFAIAAGVLSARLHGVGCDIDVSLFEVTTAMLNYLATWNLSRGFEPTRLPGSAHPSLVPSQMFATSDGALMVMCNKEVFYVTLCDRLGRPDLASDPRYKTATARLEHRDELVATLTAIFATATTEEWIALLGGAVPVAKVQTIAESLRSDIVAARNVIVEVEHPTFGVLREIGTPFRFADDTPTYRPAPALGADTTSVLETLLGYDQERLRAFRDVGAIGPADDDELAPRSDRNLGGLAGAH